MLTSVGNYRPVEFSASSEIFINNVNNDLISEKLKDWIRNS